MTKRKKLKIGTEKSKERQQRKEKGPKRKTASEGDTLLGRMICMNHGTNKDKNKESVN